MSSGESAPLSKNKGLLDAAIADGANVLEGGASDDKQRYIADFNRQHDDNSSIMQEEIFGPVLPIVTYTDLDEAISYINNKPKPLALYVLALIKNVLRRYCWKLALAILASILQ